MGKPTGQMKEDTRNFLTFIIVTIIGNTTYGCFIDNHTEEEFQSI